ncbi:hypothetical protein QL285_030007 [Trifolium repens]|nr:hypothetical protein QL285_030007 [Trifolium repens]
MTSCFGHNVDDMQSTVLEEDYERHLNLINKARVTTIRTKSGYIVDCVDINKQPAFDHPLLKNHKLQRKPSFERKLNETGIKISPNKSIDWFEKIRCPKGTVHIKRITKDDLIRGKSLFNQHSLAENSQVIHIAKVFMKFQLGAYYAVSGITSIYNPKVGLGQSSTGHLYVQKGKEDGTNTIVVGWHVSPQLYKGAKDDATYFYSVWTPDNFKTGCYNMLCSGFVQTDQSYHLSGRITKTSTYGGEMIEMPIAIHQDNKSGNWWLRVVNKDIGYFPKALFSNMDSADQVGWGGSTSSPAGVASPPMGSGQFPNDDFIYGAYFREVAYQDNQYNGIYHGPYPDFTDTYNDGTECYGVAYYGDQKGEVGCSLMFGGPGGNCNS